MNWNKKTIIGLVFIFPLVLVMAWLGLYQYGVSHIQSHIRKAIETLNTRGYAVSYDDIQITGTPFQISAIFTHPVVVEEENLFRVSSQQLTLSIHPWNYKQINFHTSDGMSLTGPSLSDWKFTELLVDGFSGQMTLDNRGRLESLSLLSDQLTPRLAGKELPLTILLFQCHFPHAQNLLSSGGSISFQLAGLHNLLGQKDFNDPMQLSFNYELSNTDNPSHIKTLTQWRDANGQITVNQLSLSWLSLQIQGGGKLGLDDKFRPQGSLEAAFIGYDEVLDMWVQAGYLDEKNVENVKFALNIIAGQDELGRKQIKVPVDLKKGYLKIGPAKLVKLPPVVE